MTHLRGSLVPDGKGRMLPRQAAVVRGAGHVEHEKKTFFS